MTDLLDNNDNHIDRSDLRKLQDKMWKTSKVQGEKRIDKAHDRDKKFLANTEAGMSVVENLITLTADGIDMLIDDAEQAKGGPKPAWYKAFKSMPTYLSADVALRTVLDAVGKGWTYPHLCQTAGKCFSCTYVDHLMEGNADRRADWKRYERRAIERLGDTYTRVDIYWERAAQLGFDRVEWSKERQRLIGVALVNAVMMATNVIDIEKLRQENRDQAARFPVLTEEFEALLKTETDALKKYAFFYEPVVYPPNDWGLHSHGPYEDNAKNHSIDVVRNAGAPQREALAQAMRTGQLSRCLDALNTIQSTPFTINSVVLEAVKWVYQKIDHANDNNLAKVTCGNFPDLRKYPVPVTKKRDDWATLKPEIQDELVNEAIEIKQHNAGLPGARTNLDRHIGQADNLLRLQTDGDEIAPGLKVKADCFYLPCNWDTRNRVYPIPDFNYQKADYLRALFLFSNKTPVTPEALDDIKIQAANSWGNKVDKRPDHKRIEWVDENWAKIIAAGQNFKAGWPFWKDADEPFTFLAACVELAAYAKHGEAHMSGLPCARDASQSGIQHFAMASLHPGDAEKVNLTDKNETPNDIYEDCLAVAKRLIAEQKAEDLQWQSNDPVTPQDLAEEAAYEKAKANPSLTKKDRRRLKRQWDRTPAAGRLKRDRDIVSANEVEAWYGAEYLPYGRSVIKRNCMTFGYSSTAFGFTKQLQKDWMKEISKLVRDETHPLTDHPFTRRGLYASSFLGTQHYRAILEVVKSAERGMTFIRNLTRNLAHDDYDLPPDQRKGQHLTFTTPLGFPMHQNYTVTEEYKQRIPFFDRQTNLLKKRDSWLHLRKDTPVVDVEDSVDACAPNIIHSMDATHLMLVVLKSKERGLNDFLLVHDSFATTPGNVTRMKVIINYTLAELYGNGFCLYQELLDQNLPKMRHPEGVTVNRQERPTPTVPHKGDEDGNLLDLNSVKRNRFGVS